MAVRIWALVLCLGLAGCAPTDGYASLPQMGTSVRVVAQGGTPQPVASPASEATPEPAQAATASAALEPKELPTQVSLPGGMLPYEAKDITGTPYEAADFTCKYAPTWAPFPPSAEELAAGQVMYLGSEYNYAWMEVRAFKATHPLEVYYGAATRLLEEGAELSTVWLGEVKGYQIHFQGFYNGKKLERYALGFVREGRFISIVVEFEPGSKDVELMKKEYAYVFATWEWRKS